MSDEPLILAINQGTTNTKAIFIDRDGRVVGQATRPLAIEYPRPGWVQQDGLAIWRSVQECVDDVL